MEVRLRRQRSVPQWELPVTLHDERGGEVRLIEVTVAYTQTTALQTVTTRERITIVSAPEALL